ncbi:hypothetical protein QFC22_000457 [Naganishia vaughanmartiniae]|uniref:Uncharacterized protein n=1 Tax=Naganishia vaughanmartiniae TaxID=1424756 RepID=A0ACC2XPC3_9TREE|nr:hypothetical protein QFC22_000457 [Naganishia vaughanmartiniae]
MPAQTNGQTNGTTSRKFENGVYTPLTTPMTEDEEIDIASLKKQVVRLANAGMGIVLLGTNGEASHLMDNERSEVIKASREALDLAGHQDVPLLVGTGGGSAKHTIALAEQAKAAGADYSIVICPGYFAFAMGSNKDAVKGFFNEVLDHSVLPVMIYNFPGAASGIDLDSDTLIALSEHPNCFGAKLTCGNVGKGSRLAAHTQSKAYLSRHAAFQVLPGFSDIMYPGMVVGMTGCITGTGNIIPKTMVKLYNVGKKAIDTGDREAETEALELHRRVAAADWIVVKAGISGTKLALETFVGQGCGGVPRKPLPRATEETVKLVEDLRPFWEFESTL